jgi:hypothetical protein
MRNKQLLLSFLLLAALLVGATFFGTVKSVFA